MATEASLQTREGASGTLPPGSDAPLSDGSLARSAVEFAQQAEKLSPLKLDEGGLAAPQLRHALSLRTIQLSSRQRGPGFQEYHLKKRTSSMS